jgi:hypothetical protein
MPHQRPQSNEYFPHQERYISLVRGPVLTVLRDQQTDLQEMLRGVAESDAGYRYAPGKWSIREVVGHISDAERIYQYRALAFARGDTASLPRYDPDGYVEMAGFDHRTVPSLVEEFLSVRASTICFFQNLDPAIWSRGGTVAGGTISVRALAYIAAGHARQHLNVLRDSYGVYEAAAARESVA